MKKTIRINGGEQSVIQDDLASLIASLQQESDGLVVEHNGRIVREQEWPETSLKDGDVIELLRFVGGG